MKRDPRIDPKPGDIVIFGPQWQLEQYKVLKNSGVDVRYQMITSGAMQLCSLNQWRRWAENAEVIHASD
jgi:hypothetical protein